METAETLQRRIRSFEDLRSIVSTMKALSAVSIRQYERAVESLRDYYRTVALGLHVALQHMQPIPTGSRARGQAPVGAVVFGSDHGLCGRFNEDVADHALNRLVAVGAGRRVLAVGARVAAHLEHAAQPLEEVFFVPGAASRITATVQRILLKIDAWRTESGTEDVRLYYNRHLSGASYEVQTMQLLPLDPAHLHGLRETGWPSRVLPTFRLPREALLASLVRQYLFVSLFRACAESQASEHGSRLAAMQSAEKNLDERLEEITLQFRSTRQNAITGELLDVVAGFEALSEEH